jgi:hypothetical protein
VNEATLAWKAIQAELQANQAKRNTVSPWGRYTRDLDGALLGKHVSRVDCGWSVILLH